MDANRFDMLVKTAAMRSTRRRMLAGILMLTGGVLLADDTSAARRGFSGPKVSLPTPTPVCDADGTSCVTGAQCCSGCCLSDGGPFVCSSDPVCDL